MGENVHAVLIFQEEGQARSVTRACTLIVKGPSGKALARAAVLFTHTCE